MIEHPFNILLLVNDFACMNSFCWLGSLLCLDAPSALLPDVGSPSLCLFLVGPRICLVPLKVALLLHPERLLLGDLPSPRNL
jgi:hypothetical protein